MSLGNMDEYSGPTLNEAAEGSAELLSLAVSDPDEYLRRANAALDRAGVDYRFRRFNHEEAEATLAALSAALSDALSTDRCMNKNCPRGGVPLEVVAQARIAHLEKTIVEILALKFAPFQLPGTLAAAQARIAKLEEVVDACARAAIGGGE